MDESCQKAPAVSQTLDIASTMATRSPKKAQVISSLQSTIFILSTLIVVSVAFRNTLTWHMQRFWGASGNFWQSCWESIFQFCGKDDFNVIVWGSYLITFVVYWGIGGLYTIVDLTGRPAFLLKYKIQDAPNTYPVEAKRVWKVILQVLFNQFCVGLPMVILGYHFYKIRGFNNGELPTFQWVLLELIVFILLEEIGFYYAHRLLHHPRIYKYVHKQHHEWTAPISITAIYCHPIEHIFSNMVPPYLGPILMGAHSATIWLWFTLVILSTLNAHSGFHLPFFPSPEAHDFHHLKFNQCFGILGVLDRLHGTDSAFRASSIYQRHIMLLSLVPIKQLYPDNTKEKANLPPKSKVL